MNSFLGRKKFYSSMNQSTSHQSANNADETEEIDSSELTNLFLNSNSLIGSVTFSIDDEPRTLVIPPIKNKGPPICFLCKDFIPIRVTRFLNTTLYIDHLKRKHQIHDQKVIKELCAYAQLLIKQYEFERKESASSSKKKKKKPSLLLIDPDKEKLVCRLCQCAFEISELKRMIAHHRFHFVRLEQGRLVCTRCEKNIFTNGEFTKHFVNLHESIDELKRIQCMHCEDKVFEWSTDQDAMEAHINAHHQGLNEFYCQKCNIVFSEWRHHDAKQCLLGS